MSEEFSLDGALDQCPPASHLYICVPAYDNRICIQTSASITAGIAELVAAGIEVVNGFVAGCCYLDHTRNMAVNKFLKSDATDLLFVDADVACKPEYFPLIARQEVPLVAGIYPKKSEQRSWPLDLLGWKVIIDSRGLMSVNGLPTGFMRINRKVFDKMREAGVAPKYVDPLEGEMHAYFQTVVEKEIFWGEDYNFCRRWREIGGKCYAIPDLDFCHIGTKTWKDNLMSWIRDNASSVKEIPDPEAGKGKVMTSPNPYANPMSLHNPEGKIPVDAVLPPMKGAKKNDKGAPNGRVLRSPKPDRRRAKLRKPLPGSQPQGL